MKKFVFLLIAVSMFFFGFSELKADSISKEEKPIVNIQGWNFYASMLISFNGGEDGLSRDIRQVYIKDFEVEYDEANSIVIGTVKRSTINDVIEDTDYTVSSIAFNLDFYDYNLAYSYLNKVTARTSTLATPRTFYQVTFASQITEDNPFITGLIFGGTDFAGSNPFVAEENEVYAFDKGVYEYSDDLVTNGVALAELDKTKAIKSFKIKVATKIVEDVEIDIKNITKYTIPPVITTDDLNASTNNNTDIIYEMYNNARQLMYSWNFENGLVAEEDYIEFESLITFDNSPYEVEISEELNLPSEEIKYLTFKHHGKLPKSATITVNVSDKFKKNETTSLFYYNETTKKLEEYDKNLIVDENGYVSFQIDHCSDYVLAKTDDVDITLINKVTKENKESNTERNYKLITIAVSLVILLITLIYFIIKKKSMKK